MKKLLLFACFFLIVNNLQAQAPEKFNYQGIARDNTGAALANQNLGLRISIMDAASTAVYVETHSVTTNDFGLYHIAIGDGTPITGTMNVVNWANGNKQIKVEIDPNGGTNYTDLGTTELLSVPYALYSMESGDSGNYTAGDGISITGNSISADLGTDIDNSELQNDAVTSTKILDAEIVEADLADNAVTSLKIADGTIATVDLANNSVTATKLDGMGATTDQVLKFDGTNWIPATDDSGLIYTAGTGVAISGTNEITADLGIDIDNTELQKDAVTSTKILDAEIVEADLADNAVTSLKVADGTIATSDLANNSVTAAKLDAMGATTDQVLKFDGTNWIPSTDDSGTAYTAGTGVAISGTNEIIADLGIDIDNSELQNDAVTSTKILDAEIVEADLADNAVTSPKILDGTVITADLANNSVTAAKLDAMGATTDQVLKFDGTNWMPGTDDSGLIYTAGTGVAISGTNEITANLGIDIDNTELQNDAVTSTKILDAEIVEADLADNAVTSLKIVDGTIATSDLADDAVTAPKIADMGANAGQVLKFDGVDWAPAADDPGTAGWELGGNTATTTNFIGTVNNADLRFKVYGRKAGVITSNHPFNTAFGLGALYSSTTGTGNTATGHQALYFNTTGYSNVAFGRDALAFNTTGFRNSAFGGNALRLNTTGNSLSAFGIQALYSNTTGNYNVAIGVEALRENTTASYNIAVGYQSLYSNTTGDRNTATGYQALYSNTTGVDNTAFGLDALEFNTTGDYNTAVGVEALQENTTGNRNSAFGLEALFSNTFGSWNSAFGQQALSSNTTGDWNSAFGEDALYSNTTGYENSGFGQDALSFNTTGYRNSAFGTRALYVNTTGSGNSAFGTRALNDMDGLTTSENTGLGAQTDIADFAFNATAIGYGAYANVPSSIVLGNTTVSFIGGYAPWSNLSDVRFKKEMEPLEHGLDFIMKLEPITYHMNMQKLHNFVEQREGEAEEKDPEWLGEAMAKKEAILYTGFSAQQVEKAAQDVGYDFSAVHKPENENDHYTLAYAQFVVPLVKAVQEQQEMIIELKNKSEKKTMDFNQAELQEQKSINEEQKQKIEQLEEIIQKMQARLDALDRKKE